GIVRHHALHVLRRKGVPTSPLSEADAIAGEDPAADDVIDLRQRATIALNAIATLPGHLREPALLFFVHECSHQDIATFLNMSVATVNNRLHAVRSPLNQRTLHRMTQTLQNHPLPDGFANRIGRLIEARGSIVDA